MNMTTSDRLDRLDSMIAEGRLVRNSWGEDRLVRLIWGETTDNGRETACLLAALSPEAGAAKSAGACPAQVMPEWLAHLTIWMDDNGSKEAWPAMVRRYAAVVRRYAAVARRWPVLTDDDWQRLDYTARRIAIEEALSHIPAGSEERAVSTQVVALCRRAEAGDYPTKGEWKAAAWETWGVPWAWPATRVATRVAQIATRPAQIAAEAAAEAAEAAERWTAGVARFAAADRITALILDAIEAACDRRTAGAGN